MTHDRKAWAHRKPHSREPGYVAELRCRLGGWIVIYDREQLGRDWRGGTELRWVVAHQPSGRSMDFLSERTARLVMKTLARARTFEAARDFADLIPEDAPCA